MVLSTGLSGFRGDAVLFVCLLLLSAYCLVLYRPFEGFRRGGDAAFFFFVSEICLVPVLFLSIFSVFVMFLHDSVKLVLSCTGLSCQAVCICDAASVCVIGACLIVDLSKYPFDVVLLFSHDSVHLIFLLAPACQAACNCDAARVCVVSGICLVPALFQAFLWSCDVVLA